MSLDNETCETAAMLRAASSARPKLARVRSVTHAADSKRGWARTVWNEGADGFVVREHVYTTRKAARAGRFEDTLETCPHLICSSLVGWN